MSMFVPGRESGPDPAVPAETVRLKNPQDLLTAIPCLLGFQPDRSLVIVALDDDRHLVATVNAHLPNIEEAPQAADGVAQCLALAGTTAVMVVGYCPHHEAPTLRTFAALLPWPVIELLLVSDQRWWSLACPYPGCCPDGEPVVPQDRVLAPLLVASGAPAASRDDLAASLAPGPQALLQQVSACLTSAGPHEAHDARDLYAQLVAAREARVEGPQHLPPEQAAVLLLALRNLTVRDACTIWHDDAAMTLWRDLLQVAPPDWAAPMAAVLGMAAYQRGDGVLARMAVDRALDADPTYTLADLVEQAIRRGVPPHGLHAALTAALQGNPLAAGAPPAKP